MNDRDDDKELRDFAYALIDNIPEDEFERYAADDSFDTLDRLFELKAQGEAELCFDTDDETELVTYEFTYCGLDLQTIFDSVRTDSEAAGVAITRKSSRGLRSVCTDDDGTQHDLAA